MTKLSFVDRDPFDVPGRMIPPAVIYQWCDIKNNYQTMIDAGWAPVPFSRHDDWFDKKYRGNADSIQCGGQRLMERPRNESKIAREREMDDACLAARQGRSVAVIVTVRVCLSYSELEAAKINKLSGSEYAGKKVQLIADGADNLHIRGHDGALEFYRPETPHIPRPKHRWVSWLFNLISE